MKQFSTLFDQISASTLNPATTGSTTRVPNRDGHVRSMQ